MTTRMTLLTTGGITLAAALMPGLAAHNGAPETYKIDSVHSSAIFRIKHMNVSYFWGRFNDLSGRISWDPANPDAADFDVQIKTESIDSKDAKRDNHLKSPDFFNAKQYPTLTFKGKSVKKTADKMFDITGDLTIHGVTKSITAKLEHTGSAKGMQGAPLIGFEATFEIKRSDFGMKLAEGALGDEVRIIVALEAGRE